MTKPIFVLLSAAVLVATTPAFAGSNTCEGKVTVHPGHWTSVINQDGEGCQFETKSPLGKKIISVCPNNSECMIDIELDAKGGGSGEPVPVIRYSPKDITSVERVEG